MQFWCEIYHRARADNDPRAKTKICPQATTCSGGDSCPRFGVHVYEIIAPDLRDAAQEAALTELIGRSVQEQLR